LNGFVAAATVLNSISVLLCSIKLLFDGSIGFVYAGVFLVLVGAVLDFLSLIKDFVIAEGGKDGRTEGSFRHS